MISVSPEGARVCSQRHKVSGMKTRGSWYLKASTGSRVSSRRASGRLSSFSSVPLRKMEKGRPR